MKKIYNLAFALHFVFPCITLYISQSQAQVPTLITVGTQPLSTPVIVAYAGWTITADATKGSINIVYDSLGTLLQHLQLNIENNQQLVSLKGWMAEKTSQHQLAINVIQPACALLFDLNEHCITISSSSAKLVLTAQAPASNDRIIANVIDTKGSPVTWTGTTEVVENFGGTETRTPSYLASKNPEVMTFTLGQVSSANLHSLFDRDQDIAIVFSDQSLLQRNPQYPDLLIVTIPVAGNTVIRLLPDYYTHTLGLPFYSRFNDSEFPVAPVVWGSWTSYYRDTREKDIVRNTDWLAANLKPYGFKYVQIDDGYDNGKDSLQHAWIENWDKRGLFPKGPKWMANYIKSKGLHAGLWLVPNSYAGAVTTHPDWYLRDKNGKLILDYDTPTLDFTHPGVQQWLRKLFATLKGWGFEYFKFDGEFALPKYAPVVDKTRQFDTTIDPVVSYRNRLQLIREIVGSTTFLEGCPAGTPLNGIGFFNSYFNGADVYNTWLGSYALFNAISANAFLNHIAVYVMPGEGIDVSPFTSLAEAKKRMPARYIYTAETSEDSLKGFGVSMAEARTLVSFVALTGVVYPLTSIMPALPEERAGLLKMSMPTMPILPADLFSRGSDMSNNTPWEYFKHRTPDTYIHNYPEILNLKVNAQSGIYDVVAFTNWRNEKITRKISFADKLGLSSGAAYVAFDFWRQEFVGVFRDSLALTVEAHDTRVLQLHPLLGKPQLIGNSRHITGAFSVLSLQWNEKENSLEGVSETIPGEMYDLFVYVPDGFDTTTLTAITGKNKIVQVKKELTGNILKLRFQGEQAPVKWQVRFNRNFK
ncbi:alpha-galactosidase [Ferruginibacter paludis]|uniref:alpha-galactosidase n=1 Tax=Ferruginibacter paludis TaxID=1310417 RepID=UPI0025B40373|nr:alpha-galactosidase [Ferruginibacter paludis]MDN3657150.1 alpha-galactosidase [Ferruginibacter paludis]